MLRISAYVTLIVLSTAAVAVAQPAPMYKGKRACSEQHPVCVNGCLKDGATPSACQALCSGLLKKCLADGCWVHVAFRYCGLVKQ